jgi:2-polyprenyl-6-methoxyphenol hydroxylase-like FAD-dependent oxidoreductase
MDRQVGTGEHAIVIGASMAGLLAARVLSEHFDKVTLIERDRLENEPQPRKGVPQGRHAHVLLRRGQGILAELFPDLIPSLLQGGAVCLDAAADGKWFHFGGYKLRFVSGLDGLALSRPYLEWQVRRRVLALPGVKLLDQHRVRRLIADEDQTSVRGVGLEDVDGSRRLDADLVVDATGRGSRSPAWLEAMGYRRPPETEVQVGFGYTTRFYERRPGDLGDAMFALAYPTPPHDKRMGVAFPVEGDRWQVTLGGWLGDHAPIEGEGFVEFARSLCAPDIHRLISRAEPLTEPVVHKLPSSRWRHYERLRNVPAGYVVLGDAVCSFNPVYGQGMTTAALQASALAHCLRTKADAGQFPRRYFRDAAQLLKTPWMLAVGEDFRYPEVTGPKAPGTDLVNWYIANVHRAVISDPVVYGAFLRVLHLESPPAAVFAPSILRRVLVDRRRRRSSRVAAVGRQLAATSEQPARTT